MTKPVGVEALWNHYVRGILEKKLREDVPESELAFLLGHFRAAFYCGAYAIYSVLTTQDTVDECAAVAAIFEKDFLASGLKIIKSVGVPKGKRPPVPLAQMLTPSMN